MIYIAIIIIAAAAAAAISFLRRQYPVAIATVAYFFMRY